jgi:hypothetical protein
MWVSSRVPRGKLRQVRSASFAMAIAMATAVGIASGCATTAGIVPLSDHRFDGRTGHEVLQLDHYRYTLRFYAEPQADVTAMENLLLDQATRICGFPGFRRTEPAERTVTLPPTRTPDLVRDVENPIPQGSEILHWVEVEIDCDPAFDR